MKNKLLLFISLIIISTANAQFHYQIPKSMTLVPRTNQNNLKLLSASEQSRDLIHIPYNNNPSRKTVSANKFAPLSETQLGYTTYDLQTNSAIQNRLIKNSDGTIAAVWTFIGSGGVRGSAYTYFDGVNWSPAAKVEPTQNAGFTNIVETGSGGELVIAHSPTVPGMLMTSRPVKGTGIWTEYPNVFANAANDTWAKAIAGGSNGLAVHAIWHGTGISGVPLYGQDGPLLYSRSIDGGVTWPVLRTIIPSLDSTHFFGFGPDDYALDAKGDTVAIVAGDWTTDLVLLKSIDNGTSWTTSIIDTFPIPLYNDATMMLPDTNGDGLGDNIESPSGDAHVLIDHNGLCHIWFTKVLIHDPDAASTLSYYPNASDGLYYWNENFGANAPVIIAGMEDLNGDGVISIPTGGANDGNGMGVYRGGATQMPTAGIDDFNNLYVSYQSYDELADTTVYPGVGHKHVYLVKSTDGGTTWSAPEDVVPGPPADGLLQEGVFACMAKRVDPNYVHLIYQRDYAPGHSLSSNATEAGWNADPSDIIYSKTPILWVSVDHIELNDFSVDQNIPNPALESTTVNFRIKQTSKVELKVTDVLGKVLYAETRGTINPGSYTLNLNTQNMNSGVYFYTLKVNDTSVTKKMIVER